MIGWVLGWALGCEPAPPPASTTGGAPSPGIDVALTFDGVSARYSERLSSPEERLALALALAPCTEGPATLAVTYGEGRGRVVLSAPWRAGCSPGPDGSLAPVARVGRAVAQWRNALAARFDARLAAFTVRIRVTPECDLALFGQFPPDGTSFAACDATGCGTEVVARGCR